MTRRWFHFLFICRIAGLLLPLLLPYREFCCQGKVKNGAFAGGGGRWKKDLFKVDRLSGMYADGVTLWTVENWHWRREKEDILVYCLQGGSLLWEIGEVIQTAVLKVWAGGHPGVSETFSGSPRGQNIYLIMLSCDLPYSLCCIWTNRWVLKATGGKTPGALTPIKRSQVSAMLIFLASHSQWQR